MQHTEIYTAGMGREYKVDIHVYVNIIQDNKIHEQLD
jgi:hypothetical protein